MKRISKKDYYLGIAKEVSKRGTCLRRNYGSIIVKNDEIIATGYTGAPRGQINCSDTGKCRREELNIPSGTRYELCRSVHSEMNCIIEAARKDMIGSVLYLYGYDVNTGEEVENLFPCDLCKRAAINAGIKFIVTKNKTYDLSKEIL